MQEPNSDEGKKRAGTDHYNSHDGNLMSVV